jgi:hypothetical protein
MPGKEKLNMNKTIACLIPNEWISWTRSSTKALQTVNASLAQKLFDFVLNHV